MFSMRFILFISFGNEAYKWLNTEKPKHVALDFKWFLSMHWRFTTRDTTNKCT